MASDVGTNGRICKKWICWIHRSPIGAHGGELATLAGPAEWVRDDALRLIAEALRT